MMCAFTTVNSASPEILTHTRSESAVNAARAELVLHCTFNDGKARDSSGKKNHGVLTKGVTLVEGRYGQALRFVGGPRPNRGRNTRTAFPYRWKQDLPLFVRAMVKTPGKLIVAGPEDIIDKEKVKPLRRCRSGWIGSPLSWPESAAASDGPL